MEDPRPRTRKKLKLPENIDLVDASEVPERTGHRRAGDYSQEEDQLRKLYEAGRQKMIHRTLGEREKFMTIRQRYRKAFDNLGYEGRLAFRTNGRQIKGDPIDPRECWMEIVRPEDDDILLRKQH